MLKAFLLMTFTVAAGLSPVSLVSHAQQSTVALTGEWVSNSEPSGRSEFVRLSLSENAGEMLRPLKAKLSLVRLEGSRVRLELSSLKLVMTGTLAGYVIEGDTEVPGTKARFHLVRTVKVAPEILARYVGAYLRNGDYLVIDSFPDTPDTLAASRMSEAAFAIALSGGGLSPAEQELFDSDTSYQKRAIPRMKSTTHGRFKS